MALALLNAILVLTLFVRMQIKTPIHTSAAHLQSE